jgi:hypothetical protein
VDWPEERRLGDKDKGKGKRRSLNIWVDEGHQDEGQGRILSVPAHLIPDYSPVPLFAKIYLQELIELNSTACSVHQ